MIFIIKGFRTTVFIFIVAEKAIKMKTLVRKPLMIKIKNIGYVETEIKQLIIKVNVANRCKRQFVNNTQAIC